MLMKKEFTWVATYKELAKWICGYENNQKELINILKSIGITRFVDYEMDGSSFELEEIDPFTFFSYLNKFKNDANRLRYLQELHKKLDLKSQLPMDVNGIPTSHPMKVWLFPYKRDRTPTDISNLWALFKQALERKIDDALFHEVLKIRCVGKGKLTICWFYIDPEYYIPLDSQTSTYLRKRYIKYIFSTYPEYDSIRINVGKELKRLPYQISSDAKKLIEYIESVEDLLKRINDSHIMDSNNSGYYYRGQSDENYKLIPGIYRNRSLINNEHIIVKDIESAVPSEFSSCRCTFDKLVKMQHYELPTRLLDITANPLVALFFACFDEKTKDKNGALYKLEIKSDTDIPKYSDSDAVSVVANIARRPSDFEIASIRKCNIQAFNKKDAITYLLHEIRCSEKPHFLPVINIEDIEKVFFVKPKMDNPRIVKQEGAFLLFGIDGEKVKFKEADDFFDFKKYIIPFNKKSDILKQLDLLGINEASLFPEISHIASYIKNKYT